MPFTPTMEQHIRELVQDELSKVVLNTPQDFDDLCFSIIPVVDDKVRLSLGAKYIHTAYDLKDLLIEGFDLYATDQIPAFTSKKVGRNPEAKISDSEKIKEAREEFKNIILSEIKAQIKEKISLSPEERALYIKQQKETQENRKKLAEHRVPAEDSEAHVLSEEQGHLNTQLRLYTEDKAAGMTAELAARLQDLIAAPHLQGKEESVILEVDDNGAISDKYSIKNGCRMR